MNDKSDNPKLDYFGFPVPGSASPAPAGSGGRDWTGKAQSPAVAPASIPWQPATGGKAGTSGRISWSASCGGSGVRRGA